MSMVFGTTETINRIRAAGSRQLARLAVAAEKTAVDTANHAKADHIKGAAHGVNRYENQTTTLTRSITPLLTIVTPKLVEAIVHTSNVEYAMKVEMIYPYLFPAMVANQENFKRRIRGALL